ncbi:hypothetical protein [Streptomyces aureus]|jgi:hypothetical protein|uniref:hypothetical protein n=1 Tax=Streptomyces aureus TaxID=193461 RepID=UPI0036B1DF49
MTSTSTEVEPAPVFVDRTGQRGRRLRGLGWLVGILCTGCVAAMISGLVGTQSQAPALSVPGTADTTPPSQYLNAPLPAAPGAARPTAGITAGVTLPDATASVTTAATLGATAPVTTANPAATSGAGTPVTTVTTATTPDATAPVTAATAGGTGATSSVTAAAQ